MTYPALPGVADDQPEIAVVGKTVHILWVANDPQLGARTVQVFEEAREARDLAREAEQSSMAILNSLQAQVAVIGADGTIVVANDVWDRFG